MESSSPSRHSQHQISINVIRDGCVVPMQCLWHSLWLSSGITAQLLLSLTLGRCLAACIRGSYANWKACLQTYLEVLTWEGWQEAWRPDPKADIQEPYSLVVRGMEDPQEEPQAVHCFCVCSALLGDILGVNRSMEHDLLFCHFILGFSCMYSSCILWLGILAALLYSAICSCVLVVLV